MAATKRARKKKPAVKPAISFQALAVAVGVSRKRVMGAISRQEISPDRLARDGSGRTVIVDAEGAEADLRAAVEFAHPAPDSEPTPDTSEIDFDNPETWPTNLPGLKAVREHHITRQAKIKADQSAGLLVEVAKVRRDWFEASRTVRDHLMKIPDRVSHDAAAVMGAKDVDAVRDMIREGIERGLQDLAGALVNKLPAEAAEAAE